MGNDLDWPEGVRTELVRRYIFSPVLEPLVFCHAGPDGMNYRFPANVPRWKGEILRYGADLYLQHPAQVVPTQELISSYCERNRIPELRDELLQAFGF
ncbi:MAG: hypothetical protein QMD85_05035 [Candidatus Aenigmarchaeota archaeon]|nr:hypothetical protein [Candidatus Aenigmarchaeota archaeon]